MNEAALRAIARMALERKTGARGLRSIMVRKAQTGYGCKEAAAESLGLRLLLYFARKSSF